MDNFPATVILIIIINNWAWIISKYPRYYCGINHQREFSYSEIIEAKSTNKKRSLRNSKDFKNKKRGLRDLRMNFGVSGYSLKDLDKI
jgi:hypothetical protein